MEVFFLLNDSNILAVKINIAIKEQLILSMPQKNVYIKPLSHMTNML